VGPAAPPFGTSRGRRASEGKRAGLARTTKRVSQDSPVEVLLAATRNLQDRRRRLYLLDEFSMPFLYQAMKANDYRQLGLYAELESLLQKCTQPVPGTVGDAKIRMIRTYDTHPWGYGIKGETSFGGIAADALSCVRGCLAGGLLRPCLAGHAQRILAAVGRALLAAHRD
jgi:hypothetical protein